MERKFMFVLLCGLGFSLQQQCPNVTVVQEKKQQGCACYGPRQQRPSYQYLLNAWRQNLAMNNRRNSDCDSLFLNGERTSGVHSINLRGTNMQVFCEFQFQGRNWVVIQRRASGAMDFDLGWQSYQGGFGDPTTNYWLGLNAIHLLSLTLRRPLLRIDITDATGSSYAEYRIFRVATALRNYRLRIGGYSGTAGDALIYHNGAPFSTMDNDNDLEHFGRNCAMLYGGGWWFKDCLTSNLNGRYGRSAAQRDGIIWYFWRTKFDSMQTTVMRLRTGC